MSESVITSGENEELRNPLPELSRRNYWGKLSPDDFVRYPPYFETSYYDETKLILKAQSGCVISRNEVWIRNVRMVLSVVNQFAIPEHLLADAIQEGSIGLKRAIEKYDLQKYSAFSTYSWYWIYQRIQRFLQINRGRVRVSGHIYKNYCQFRQELRAAQTPRSVETIICHWRGRDPNMFSRLFSIHLLNTATSLHSCPEVFGLSAPEKDLDDRADSEQRIAKALTRLNARERQIVERRFGLDGDPEETLEEIGQKFNPPVSRERIRQLEAIALKKLARVLSPDQGNTDMDSDADFNIADCFLQDCEDDCEDTSRIILPPIAEVLLAHFSSYPFRQANALIHYYGLAGEKAISLNEVASLLELTERKTVLALKHGIKKFLPFAKSHYHPEVSRLASVIESDQKWRRAF